jgi:hypothetical protein
VNRLKQAGFGYSEDAAVLHPAGADAAPLKIRDWVSGEDGALIVITSTEAQRRRLQALITAPETLQLQWAQGGRSYVLITGRDIAQHISSDIEFCDADGQVQNWIRYEVHTLAYIETIAP